MLHGSSSVGNHETTLGTWPRQIMTHWWHCGNTHVTDVSRKHMTQPLRQRNDKKHHITPWKRMWPIQANGMVGNASGFTPSEKYESVGIIVPTTWKNRTYSKRPTSCSAWRWPRQFICPTKRPHKKIRSTGYLGVQFNFRVDMEVSWHGGTPQSIHFNRVFPYKSSILAG